MNLLFDANTFLWWESEPERLSQRVIDFCNDPDNRLFLSVVSFWEIVIKNQLGKLLLKRPVEEMVARQEQENGLVVLPVTLRHVLALRNMPFHHKDPFDRLLIAQAQVESYSLLSADDCFTRYPVQAIW